ncbi:membrane protein insertase YidC [Actinopolymorpha rutila]|uniref:Membrane protein insertase YidC n=1 Tax=Actinopolymorpha rutila TaxID=446787 RepID=A0A852Z556_9ACTN|nr:YidC/Oxa1 family membrane protein insertase [Actinopolymorpha rutila]
MSWYDTILTPLYDVVSWIIRAFYTVFSPILGPDSGWTWVLSIVGLVVFIRILLIPLFVRQIRASRNMALLQPKVRELQKKYGHDRERMGQELMKLYKESGTNPFSSCLPILLQSPIFIALFRVLDGAANGLVRGSGLNQTLVDSLRHASIFGAHISDKFIGSTSLSVRIVTIVLILLMTATTFTTQRQLMRKNMPPEALTGQYAQQQKLLLYVLPLVFAVGGVNFPVGVLIYWFTTNLWTMGQQFWVIRRNPAPGTPAYDAYQARKTKKAGHRPGLAGILPGGAKETAKETPNGSAPAADGEQAETAQTVKRVQPQRLPRSKRKGR